MKGERYEDSFQCADDVFDLKFRADSLVRCWLRLLKFERAIKQYCFIKSDRSAV